MGDICVEAEMKAEELGVHLSRATRERLSKYDDDTQVAWIVNPLMEWLLQSFTSQLMTGCVVGSAPVSGVKNPTVQPGPNKIPDKIPDVKPKPDEPDEVEDMGFGLFD